jgi:hypothetical protein
MVSETLDDVIPDRRKFCYQQRLTKRNPDVINHEETTGKILKIQIFNSLNAFCVLRKSVVKNLARGRCETGSTLACSRWNSLADINRNFKFAIATPFGDWFIWFEVSSVVDGINASATKWLDLSE